VLSGTDNDVVWSVLQGHPRAAEKIGSGISVFVLSRHVKNYKQPGFFVGRTDGTVVDFAIKKCFNRVTKGDETAWRLIMKRLIASGEFPGEKRGGRGEATERAPSVVTPLCEQRSPKTKTKWCNECDKRGVGHVDRTDGLFYCNVCWSVWDVYQPTESQWQSGWQ
jgi:hypothetical protein